MSPRLAPDAVRGMLKARDPFELIRWLAYSQPDPRKALAELVQNSLDASASVVRITRFLEDGKPAVRIFDDGQGVIPEMERKDALQYVATHIGHSRKRHLSPQERLSLMTQGQYGIGLLGFWSLGDRLEMRSALPGGRPHRLVLYRDRPGYLVEPLREHLPLGDRTTEIVVFDLDEAALAATAGRRAADYLASELRGQLLARRVALEIEDRLSRGGSGKVLRVVPAPLPGRPIAGIAEIEVVGVGAAKLDVGLWDGPADSSPGIALYCGGTRVAERLCSLSVLGLDRAPWTDARLTGSIECPHLTVPPGSREGVLPDAAALALAAALGEVAPRIASALDEAARAEEERAERAMIRELRAAFESVARRRPGLVLLPVAPSSRVPGPASPRPAPRRPEGLLPPGPLAEVVVAPDGLALPRGGIAVLRASGRDALGHAIDRPVTVRWATEGVYATIHGGAEIVGRAPAGDEKAEVAGAERAERFGRPESAEGSVTDNTMAVNRLQGGRSEGTNNLGTTMEATLHAGDEAGSGTIVVTATADGRECSARLPFEVLSHAVPRAGGDGVPDPTWVEDGAGAWRSRRAGERWEINAAHPDWRACEGAASKLRYVTVLLAREIALANAAPGEEAASVLDLAVSLVIAAERQMRARATSRSRPASARSRPAPDREAPSRPPPSP